MRDGQGSLGGGGGGGRVIDPEVGLRSRCHGNRGRAVRRDHGRYGGGVGKVRREGLISHALHGLHAVARVRLHGGPHVAVQRWGTQLLYFHRA